MVIGVTRQRTGVTLRNAGDLIFFKDTRLPLMLAIMVSQLWQLFNHRYFKVKHRKAEKHARLLRPNPIVSETRPAPTSNDAPLYSIDLVCWRSTRCTEKIAKVETNHW
jgi:hypothetical protein